ncbi:hypothetical protein E3N88_14701 [Mikania micrantha]|uniref:Reverse transcriptase domain-containing protein n=1 Tax=Mikania micrantha TaxID=192012 RepID=A0A5N6P3W1_9ASTR|nr:hypothetical protein E3N88_14701 [Mikania micrantha]
MKLAEIEFETRRNRAPVEIKRKRQVLMIMTSSRYAMRRNTTFAVREGFRGFPACFVIAMLQQLIAKDQHTQVKLQEHDTLLRNQQSAFLDLQRSVGDIAKMLDERQGGSFSGNTEANPKGHVKAVTTRSGRGGEKGVEKSPDVDVEEPVDEEIELETPDRVHQMLGPASTAPVGESSFEKKGVEAEKKKMEEKRTPEVDISRLPYPARALQQKYAQEYGHFLEMFKQLKINLPFVEALQHMPKYAKFLKDLLSNKKKLESLSTVTLGARCSALVQNKLPEKLDDPGVFTIPCLFGSSSVNHALADLGASINLMPYSTYQKLDLGDPSPTRMSITLADRSVKYPRGIVENVLVKVDKFVFPADFVILDMEADDRVPLIMGRPFLRTAKAMIDVFEGKITLSVGEENVTFDVRKLMKHSNDQDDSVYFLDSFIPYIDRCLDYISGSDLLKDQDLGEENQAVEIDASSEHIPSSLASKPPEYPTAFEVFESTDPVERPSVEAPPSLELKELPSHLEYAFLDGDSDLPVIISSSLTEEEKSRLIEVLKTNKQVIAWKLMDIKGIHPSFCTHRILMEEDYKPVVQPQRRLNPNMSEVVKKEVLKLLDAGLIYPISDSAWVSPVQVVPKKGGMTVIVNEKKELIPSRTVTGWRVCIDYRRLNDATRKDHFPLPFIDQMLERLSGQQFYCFLDGFSGYFQIPIAPEDQEKTTFTCPYGTFAYRRMPFGLCNAPATFQRCTVAIFQDMIETSMEVFMDDFSVFGSSFDHCLQNLDKMLARCVETNLMLNWEKCHFMVTEGIVLEHKISRDGIEVDRAKIETISKLPPPTNVRAVRSFLGHAGMSGAESSAAGAKRARGSSSSRRRAREISYSSEDILPIDEDEAVPIDQRVLRDHTVLQFEQGTEEATRCDIFVTMEHYHNRTYDRELLERLGRLDEFDAIVRDDLDDMRLAGMCTMADPATWMPARPAPERAPDVEVLQRQSLWEEQQRQGQILRVIMTHLGIEIPEWYRAPDPPQQPGGDADEPHD